MNVSTVNPPLNNRMTTAYLTNKLVACFMAVLLAGFIVGMSLHPGLRFRAHRSLLAPCGRQLSPGQTYFGLSVCPTL